MVEQADGNLNITSGNIVVADVYTFGLMSWTLFENKDFLGRTACCTPTAEIQRHSPDSFGLPSIGSVIRGCTNLFE